MHIQKHICAERTNFAQKYICIYKERKIIANKCLELQNKHKCANMREMSRDIE